MILRKTLRTDIWIDFLKNALQRGRLATQFEMLFVKFGMESVIQTSYELGILNSITGLDWQQIMPSLRLLLCLEGTVQYLNRLNFYQFVYIHYCIQVPLEAQSPILAKWVRFVQPMHQLHFDYIDQQLLNKEKECYVNHPTLNKMIKHIQSVYQPSDSKSLSL